MSSDQVERKIRQVVEWMAAKLSEKQDVLNEIINHSAKIIELINKEEDPIIRSALFHGLMRMLTTEISLSPLLIIGILELVKQELSNSIIILDAIAYERFKHLLT